MLPPRYLMLFTNRRCNSRCQSCTLWNLPPLDSPPIAVAVRARIVEEFSWVAPGAAVVICGGEPLLDPDEYYAVTEQCAALGLRCLSVTNGTLIRDEAKAAEIVSRGPSELTVSINSHVPSVHDTTRGVPGSWKLATDAVRLLGAARRSLGRPMKLYVMAVIGEYNYRELDAFYDFVLNDLGADKLKLNWVQPIFCESRGPHVFFADNWIRDPDDAMRIVTQCDQKYNLGINPKWRDDVAMYYHSVAANADAERGWQAKGTERAICDSYERNITVDMKGMMRLCFADRFPGMQWKEPGDLRIFWNMSNPVRADMQGCKALCAIGHAVRRENATLK